MCALVDAFPRLCGVAKQRGRGGLYIPPIYSYILRSIMIVNCLSIQNKTHPCKESAENKRTSIRGP